MMFQERVFITFLDHTVLVGISSVSLKLVSSIILWMAQTAQPTQNLEDKDRIIF